MKENKLTVTINWPIQKVFDFVLDPKNTPLWIESLLVEQRSAGPIQVGTEYRNQNRGGKWSIYHLTKFEPPNMFAMTSDDKNYHVQYSFKSQNQNETELEYYEWVEKADLPEPFKRQVLEQLKKVMEREG